ncbi:MAG: adenylyl-sulfate kinase [Nitrospirae bacterium]|nr:adenylyl-sulfate kinase [Nitrospirota bacterium]
MNTLKTDEGFAVWVTGLPASGKSSVAGTIEKRLHEWYTVKAVRLESDALRKVLTPEPVYSQKERDWFYDVMIFMGRMLIANGINVIFDATGNKRVYRDKAKASISKFIEVYMKCPLHICMERDPKGIYKSAQTGKAHYVPGLQDIYEEPLSPDIIIESDKATPEIGADHVIARMKEKGWV